MCNIFFPFEICKSSIKFCIFGGGINKTEILASFMAFIIPRKESISQGFRSGILNENEDAVMYDQSQPVQMLKLSWKNLLK